MKRIFIFFALVLALASCKQAPVNTNGIWLWSKFMNEVNLDDLHAKAIDNIILHEVAFERHGVDSTMAFIHEAQGKGMKVHIWFQAFYKDGKWINPVDDSLNRYKQEYFDEVIERAIRYVKYGVDGIHLDYIRFGGTAHKHNPSEEITATGCVTEFCKQISQATKAVNPKIILSASGMCPCPRIRCNSSMGRLSCWTSPMLGRQVSHLAGPAPPIASFCVPRTEMTVVFMATVYQIAVAV